MTDRRRILVTSALPYANGPIHLGYLLEAVQTDVWVRFQKLRGHECYYVCADDTHGTPIMLKAQAEGTTPEALIERVNVEHKRDLAEMLIGLDNFGSTHSPETQAMCDRMYHALQAANTIDRRTVRQAYDDTAHMFLPDRYVKGICPNCGTADQYGDSCENCGATYTPADLKNPISVVTGTAPVWRESEHYFFRLSAFEARLAAWVKSGAVQASVAHKLDEWFTQGLKDWDISRDSPYFGFEIPNAPGKYFYVWFDAPIGYLGSFRQLCDRTALQFDDFLAADSRAELHHFIGKDILYFHTLFWPAVLEGAGLRRPTSVHAHGFVTINGQKMSKSRGTFITARRYLASFKPEYLRYYFAAKLGPGIDDIDMNLGEFTTRLNSDIVGKLVNIASRCAGFITRDAGGTLAAALPDPELYGTFVAAGESIAAAYETRDTAAAIREIMGLAAHANQYIDEHKPWALAKQAAQSADAGDLEVEVQRICTQGLNLFRVLMIYLQPVLPAMAAEVQRFFRESSWSWDDVSTPLLGTAIEQYRALATRLDAKAVARLIEPEAGTPPAPGAVEASSTTAASTAAAANTGARNTQPPTAGAATAGSANAGAANAGSANTRSSNARSPSAHSDNARSSEAGSADSQNARSSDARSAHSDNAPSSGARSPSAHSDNAPSSDAHSPSAHSDNTRSRKADSVSAHSDNARSAGAGSAGASRQTVSPPGASDTAALAAAAAVEGNLITIDEFLRVDLRVARVLSADLIAGADKLLKLRLDVGELGEREIFAGIRSAYDPALLAGRLIVVVANLEPRKMRFGVSEGMMLAAGPGGKDIFILSPDSGAAPGMRVK